MDVVIAAGDAPWEADALGEVEASAQLRLVRRCVDVADLLAVAHGERADAAIVSVELGGLDLDTVHRIERAGVRVAAVGGDRARAQALGIQRHLQLGSLHELARDVPARAAAPDARRAPAVAVWGPAGAPGRSTVALGLASSAAARGTDTVLVDADTYGGSLGQMLGVLDDVSGVVAACRAANQGRAHEVVEHLLEMEPRLRMLTGVPRADMWSQVRAGALDVVIAQLRQTTDLVVIDCGASLEASTGPASTGRNQTTLQVLEQADHVVAVGRPDPVGLARLIRGLHDLREVLPGVEPTLAINLMRSSLGWTERDVTATIGRLTGTEPAVFLPFDQAGLDLAAVSGRTPREASPSSPFVARVEVLTAQVLTAVSPAVLAAPAL